MSGVSGLAERRFSDPPRVPPRPQQGSLIEVVNRDGSFVYGSLLGVFILAIMTKRATATGAFVGLIAGMAAVLTVALELPWIEFLWHNLIGAVVVVAVGMAISYAQGPNDANLR